MLHTVIVGPERRGGGLRIHSAEIYDDCVIIRWELIVDEDASWCAHVAAPVTCGASRPSGIWLAW